jgi:hypothetical protein
MSASALTLNAGATSYAFTLHGNANGNPGVSTTMYRLFDVANTSDKIERKFVFKFGQAVGIADEINPAAVLSAPYPNPATQSAEVRFQFPRLVKDAALVIYDLQGKQVAHSTISASQGLVMIDTKGFTNGMYQIVLQGEGAILAQKKLIVAQ